MNDKVYCFIYFPEVTPKYAFCMNRNYEYIGDAPELWEEIKIGEIVETCNYFFPSFDYQSTEHARGLRDNGARYIAFWINYYE